MNAQMKMQTDCSGMWTIDYRKYDRIARARGHDIGIHPTDCDRDLGRTVTGAKGDWRRGSPATYHHPYHRWHRWPPLSGCQHCQGRSSVAASI